MFAYIEKLLLAREQRGLVKDKRALVRARAHTEQQRAVLAGCQVVPAGHALVRPAGFEAVIDLVPRGTEASAASKDAREPMENTRPTIDIVECMQYPGRCNAVIGPQQAAKSWVVRHAMAEADRRGYRVIVIGPKIPPGEWQGNCEIYGPRWPQVMEGLRQATKLAEDRRQEAYDTGVATQSFDPVYLVLDDWTEIAAQVGKDAQALLISASCMFAACRIIPTFILHADTVKAWGNAVAKSLTENFFRVRIVAEHVAGRPAPERSRFGVLLPGKDQCYNGRSLDFEQWGFIPPGPPVWAETSRETSRETRQEWRQAPVYEAEEVRFPDQVSDGVSTVSTLPAAPPRAVKVLDRGRWRRFQLDDEDGAIARRIYEETGQLGKVAANMNKQQMTKGVRLTLAKAILGIPSEKYLILEA